MTGEGEYPYADQGRRLRLLRQALRLNTGSAFAAHFGWPQSGYSQFENGRRRVPLDKALQLKKRIAGFDPNWLWDDDKRYLGFHLLQQIEAEEAKEPKDQEDGRRSSGAGER